MKSLIVAAVLPLAIFGASICAQASTLGVTESVTVKLDSKKFDVSIPASERFEMLDRFAERKCETNGRTATDMRLERACKAVFKRSILSQVGDEALRKVAKQKGIS